MGSRKNWTNINLNDLDKEAKESETIVVPGKVLSMGEINKKIKERVEDFNKKKYCLKNNNNTNKDLICSYAIIMSPAGGINDYSTFIISDEIELAIKCTDRILLKFF